MPNQREIQAVKRVGRRDLRSDVGGAGRERYALQRVPWVMYFDGGISLQGRRHDLCYRPESTAAVNTDAQRRAR